MRHILILIVSILALYSCDPDIPREGINLPEMKFGFKVYPDTAYIKLGDTLTIRSSISSALSDGTIIIDGKAVIGGTIGYTEETPIETINLKSSMIEEYIYIYSVSGTYDLNVGEGLGDFYALPNDDSIKIEIKIIPKKVGTYGIQLYSKFFEGSQGKTRTQSYFDMENTHWDLWQIPEHPAPNPGEESYNKSYWFAVYE